MASVRERGVSARFVRMVSHDATFALFIGGRSGSGKSSVAGEIHEQLSSRGVMHACIEGDNLDLAHPPPQGHGLAERTWQRCGTATGRCDTAGSSTPTRSVSCAPANRGGAGR